MKKIMKEQGVELVMVPHDELKRLSAGSKAVIRTGECRAFANVILESGVVF